MFDILPGTVGGWDMVMMDETVDCGRPVSAHAPLRAAWKNDEAKYSTSLCALGSEKER